MALRLFKSVVWVVINEEEAVGNEEREEDNPVSYEELKDYLDRAVVIDLDFEECGNTCGVMSISLEWDKLQECGSEETKRRLRM